MMDCGCAGMLHSESCWPLVHRVKADISTFVHLIKCWFTLPLMTCEVRVTISNGQRNLAKGVQTVFILSVSLHSTFSWSVSSTLLWPLDIFSAFFLYTLFHQKAKVKTLIVMYNQIALYLWIRFVIFPFSHFLMGLMESYSEQMV